MKISISLKKIFLEHKLQFFFAVFMKFNVSDDSEFVKTNICCFRLIPKFGEIKAALSNPFATCREWPFKCGEWLNFQIKQNKDVFGQN